MSPGRADVENQHLNSKASIRTDSDREHLRQNDHDCLEQVPVTGVNVSTQTPYFPQQFHTI